MGETNEDGTRHLYKRMSGEKNEFNELQYIGNFRMKKSIFENLLSCLSQALPSRKEENSEDIC